MSVVAITSSRTSPGATTLAAGLAIAWSHQVERSLLIEADPAGGVLALRFDLAPAPSLTSFGSDVRNSYQSDLVWANTQELRGTRCIPAPVDPVLARSWIDRVTPTLVEELPHLGAPVVIDLGWVDHDGSSARLASAADTTLVVTRPDIAEIQALLFQVRRLQAMDTNVAIVTVGDSPNNPQEIARLAGVPLAAVLPDDPRVARALAGAEFKPTKFRRSMLWRMIGGLAEGLFDEQLLQQRSTSVTAASDFEAMRGSIEELSPEALLANPAIPSAPVELQQTHASVAALAMPAPVPPPPSTQSVAAALATDLPAAVPPRPSAESVAAALASGPGLVAQLPAPEAFTAPAPEPVALDVEPPAPTEVTPTIVVLGPPAESNRYPMTPADDQLLHDETKRLHDQLTNSAVASLVLPTGERQILGDSAFTIGRHSECDIVLNDSQVSRRHGRLVQTTAGWHYADLGSRNGTEVNGQPCTDTALTTGDVLTIGRTDLTFQTTSQREMECA